MALVKASKESDVADAVKAARGTRRTLEIAGGETKRALGRPVAADDVLDVSGLAGILSYQPEELILTARAGTQVAEIAAALAGKNQRLGFDPADWGPLLGAPAGMATIAGVLSADACGSSAVRYGRARDQLLGYRAVNGFGEIYKAGGKVVKNVTGFDLPKLMCGAFGTLGVLSEVTLRVSPRGARTAVFVAYAMSPEEGLALLRRVRASPLEATGLAFVPEGAVGHCLIRLEGAEAPLAEKFAALRALTPHAIERDDAVNARFTELASGTFAGAAGIVWRLHGPPARAAEIVRSLNPVQWYADCAGSVLWLALPADTAASDRVHATAKRAGGHAVLMRAPQHVRATARVFAPQNDAERALTASVKAAFDPLHLFNPGRMYEDI